jgi:hypothetical protein
MTNTALRQFLFAGRALFTVVTTTHRYTYRLRRGKPTDRFPKSALFARVRVGPSFEYVGIIDEVDGSVVLTQRSQYGDFDPRVRTLTRVLRAAVAGQSLPGGWEVLPSSRCGRCSRKLTDPVSLGLGIGPECRRVLGCSDKRPYSQRSAAKAAPAPITGAFMSLAIRTGRCLRSMQPDAAREADRRDRQ